MIKDFDPKNIETEAFGGMDSSSNNAGA